METTRDTIGVRRSVPVSDLGREPAVVVGTVRRLVFVPDGDEGVLVATLHDGTGDLELRVPRRHALDWAPGAAVAAEGALLGGTFVVRAYLPDPDERAGGVWTEIAPLPATAS
jgi:hypothetical protein